MSRNLTWADRLASIKLFAWLLPGTARRVTRMIRTLRRPAGRSPQDLTRYVDGVQRDYCRHVLELTGTRVELETQTPLAPGQRFVVVANHQSYFDVPSLTLTLPMSLRFVAKVELSRAPFFGPGIIAAGHVIIDRSQGEDAYRRMRAQVEASETSIVIFPEGTRTPTGALGRFKRGAFALAAETGLPILPVAVVGSYPIHPSGSFWVKTGQTVRLRVAAPVHPDGRTPEQLRDDVHRIIAGLLGGG